MRVPSANLPADGRVGPLPLPPPHISQATNPRAAGTGPDAAAATSGGMQSIAGGTGPLFRPPAGPDWRRGVNDAIAHPGLLQQFRDYVSVPEAPPPEEPLSAAEINAGLSGHVASQTPPSAGAGYILRQQPAQGWAASKMLSATPPQYRPQVGTGNPVQVNRF